MSWTKRIGRAVRRLVGLTRGERVRTRHVARGAVSHVIILDGTMSSLDPGYESNAGLTFKLLNETVGVGMSLYYEPGVQWPDWRRTGDVMLGRGINRQIRRAYGYLASRYRPGDRIFLFGFSRGAYAVRSLAGVIDRVGLLQAENATERQVKTAYRHYRDEAAGSAAAEFTRALCHESSPIEMVGVWDTVKALDWSGPLIWRLLTPKNAFHSHALGPHIRHGYHALALDETRRVYTPVMWETEPGSTAGEGRVEQVWFRGTHGDVGGQLDGFEAARPLSNIPLVWMLERAEAHGLTLPEGWRARYPTDPDAPSIGKWRGWGKIFLFRKARVVGRDPSERLHESVQGRGAPDATDAQAVM
ncbi:hypothetical protein FIU89_15555 [Roseovarius sp. THAF27]|uniref:DUF2235 domain-containing protein n=1 Tax=Roseovarius sp. THAF27 TaxID=2587850 RepID=UPI001269492B|nr:DUF2235 domain-containing protein [Roseovarius sp. THAF27]QFT82040.1 hypothetical protein FIU89_15555 [Roseovarius sp. THAF27]